MLTLPLGISPRKLLPQGSGSTQRVKTRGFDYIPQRAGKSSQTSFLERKLGKELFLRARGGSLTLALIEPVTHARGTMPPEGRYPKELGKELFLRARGGSLALTLIEPVTHARDCPANRSARRGSPIMTASKYPGYTPPRSGPKRSIRPWRC